MLLLFTLVSLSFASSRNPYEVLGVSPLATKGQIKKAWRDKAKFWHPDKNKSPEAPQKYSELREAYEKLTKEESDDWKDGEGRQDYGFSQFDHMKYDEEFSFKAFDHVLKTASHNKPYVFLVLDHPMLLHEAEQWKEKWRKLATAFDEQEINHGWINWQRGWWLRELSIHVLKRPSLIVVFEGKHKTMALERWTFENVLNLLSKWSKSHLKKLNNRDEINKFVEGSQIKGKPRVIFNANNENIPFWFSLLAKNSQFQDFAYFIQNDLHEFISIFKDGVKKPVRRIKITKNSNYHEIEKVLHSFKFNSLPRVYSQLRFDQLCPDDLSPDSVCAVFVIDHKNSNMYQQIKTQLHKKNDELFKSPIQFMYVDSEYQKEFIQSFTRVNSDKALNISEPFFVLLRRSSRINRATFTLNNYTSDSEDSVYDYVYDTYVNKFIKNNEVQKGPLAEIFNEFGPNFIQRFWIRIKVQYKRFDFSIGFFGIILLFLFIKNQQYKSSKDVSSSYSTSGQIITYTNGLLFNQLLEKRKTIKDGTPRSLRIILLSDDSKNSYSQNFKSVMDYFTNDRKLKPEIVNWTKNSRIQQLVHAAHEKEIVNDDEYFNDESLNGTVVVIKDPTADWFCLFKPSNHSSGDRCYSDKLQFFIERVVEGQEKRHAIEFQR